MNTALGSRATWSLDPNPLYPMTFMNLFDVGSDHQTALGCLSPAPRNIRITMRQAQIFF
jgi:hypothetical protein